MQHVSDSKIMTGGLLLTSHKGAELIDINTIIRIQASSNYSRISLINGQQLVTTKILRWFEKQLPSELFVRIHRTHLVNKKFISGYINGRGGKISLVNGECIVVSKRKRADFLRCWYGEAA